MKLSLLIVLALVGSALPAQSVRAADDSLKSELNAEIDALLPNVKLRNKSKRSRSRGIILANAQTDAVAAQASENVNLNNNTNLNAAESTSSAAAGTSTNVNVQVTETPAQTVEAAPLTESRLDRLKKNRLEMERSTEEKIVEKLESDRIDREKRRSKKTDNLSFDEEVRNVEIETQKVEVTQTTIAPAPVAVVQEPVVAAPVRAESTLEQDFSREAKEEGRTRWFVGGNAGLADYSAQNVKGVYAAGVILGIELPERIVIEGGMTFSSYDVKIQEFGDIYPRQIEMNQRNYSLGVKYQLTSTRIRPVAGVLVSYTTREFQDPYFTRPNSQGFDAGILIGADINVSESFSIGTDFRYYMNLSSRRDQATVSPSGYGYAYGSAAYPLVQGSSYVDEINYYVISINGTIRF